MGAVNSFPYGINAQFPYKFVEKKKKKSIFRKHRNLIESFNNQSLRYTTIFVRILSKNITVMTSLV